MRTWRPDGGSNHFTFFISKIIRKFNLVPEENGSEISWFCTFFVKQDWILPIGIVDDYNANLHEAINEMICEHNWRLYEILSLPIGLRNFHKNCINNRVQRKNDQMSEKWKKRPQIFWGFCYLYCKIIGFTKWQLHHQIMITLKKHRSLKK